MNAIQTAFLIATAVPPYPGAMPVEPGIVGSTVPDQPRATGSSVRKGTRRGFHAYFPVELEASLTTQVALPAVGDDLFGCVVAEQVSRSILALQRLRQFKSWGDNWDGEGAPAPSGAALDAATNLLGFLEAKLLKTPAVTLDGHGEPTFMVLDEELELNVTVTGPDSVDFFVASDGFVDGGSAQFDGTRLPDELAQALEGAGFV